MNNHNFISYSQITVNGWMMIKICHTMWWDLKKVRPKIDENIRSVFQYPKWKYVNEHKIFHLEPEIYQLYWTKFARQWKLWDKIAIHLSVSLNRWDAYGKSDDSRAHTGDRRKCEAPPFCNKPCATGCRADIHQIPQTISGKVCWYPRIYNRDHLTQAMFAGILVYIIETTKGHVILKPWKRYLLLIFL